MNDDSQTPETQYADMDPEAVAAFNAWHGFNDDLLKLGEFVTWLSDDDNQAALVSFFIMDREHIKSYQDGLRYQIELLGGLKEMLESTQQTVTDMMARRS